MDTQQSDTQHSEDDTESKIEARPPDPRAQVPAASRLDVTGTQVCASTLASVSAAVVASIFGVAGTIGGAALVSVVATTGSAFYGHGIRRTGVKLQKTQGVRTIRLVGLWQRIGATRGTGSSDGDSSAEAAASSSSPSSSSSAHPAPGPGPSPPGWKGWLSQRRWGVVAGVAIVFVASLATVTLIEVVGQQPLASISGREPSGSTSIGSIFDTGNQGTPDGITSTTAAVPSDSDAPSEAPGSATAPGSENTGRSSTSGGSPAATEPAGDPVVPDDATSG